MQPSSLTTRRLSARRRARARRASGGAVIFICAITLGVLAVMGAYALAAARSDLRSAGSLQRGMQANYAASYSAVAAADYVNFGNADDIIKRRMPNPNASLNSADVNCVSALKNNATTFGDQNSKMCVRLAIISQGGGATPYKGELAQPWGGREPFTTQSYQHVATATEALDTDVYIELTNPTNYAPPAGYDLNNKMKFAMVTVTGFGYTKPRGTTNLDTVRTGRGRFIIGPLNQ
jgi:hypothetical protein